MKTLIVLKAINKTKIPAVGSRILSTSTAYLSQVASLLLAVGLNSLAQPPIITTQPQSQIVLAGSDVTFAVGVAPSTVAPSYQWQVNGVDLASQANATLILTNVSTSQGGAYTVVVNTPDGSVISDAAGLTVVKYPIVYNSTYSTSLGGNVTLRVASVGPTPSSYQWQLNGTDIAGATNATLSVTNAQAGQYSVVVTSTAGFVTCLAPAWVVDSTFTKITSGPVVTDKASSWGAGWGDFDNDGLLDLAVGLQQGGLMFYHNLGDGTFSGTKERLSGRTWSVTWGDFDNDGYLDLLAGGEGSTNTLFRSNRDGTFTRMTAGQLVTGAVRTYPSGWADYDNDGFLDVFQANYVDDPSAGGQRLFSNNGDGTFTRTTNSSLVKITTGSPAGIAWGDYNNDGRMDVFISGGYGNVNLLFRNDGSGQFTRITDVAPVKAGAANWDTAAWLDYDNDGDLDLFVNKWGPGEFYRNNGDGTFTRVTQGVPQENACAAAWGDYDNDGYLDVYFAKQGQVTGVGPNALYRNNGDGTFTKIRTGSPAVDSSESITPAWGDYDNDGFLDLFVANYGGGNNFLYRNSGNSNHWLKIKLVGTASNRAAIGAKVRVQATIRGQTMWQLREVNTGTGIGGNELNPHFGLGDADTVATLRVEWPSGVVQELHNVAAKQFLTLTEPARLQMTQAGKLSIQCWKGQAFDLEASTDLSTWTPIACVTNTTGLLTCADPDVARYSQRFYRVVGK